VGGGIVMDERAKQGARELRATYGARALDECWRLLDEATAARDHLSGMHWADVAQRLERIPR
jgi:hypothetical protein